MKIQAKPVLSPNDPTLHVYAMLDGKIHLISAFGDFSFEPEEAHVVVAQIKAAEHMARHIKQLHSQIPGDLDEAGKVAWFMKVFEDASRPPKSGQPPTDVREKFGDDDSANFPNLHKTGLSVGGA